MSWKLPLAVACVVVNHLQCNAGESAAVPTIDVSAEARREAVGIVFTPASRAQPAAPAGPRFTISSDAGAAAAADVSQNPFWPRRTTTAVATATRAADESAPPPAPAPAPTASAGEPAVSFGLQRYQTTPEERETIAACLVLEAASQGDFGMRAVMSVIRNRARGQAELFAPTVLQPRQFSALNKVTAGRESLASAVRRAKRDPSWPVARAIVDDALKGDWHDATDGATHYTLSGERTHWTRRLAQTTTIGAHSFYR